MALVKHRNQTIIWLLFRSEEVKRPWHYRIGPPRDAPFPTEPLNSLTWRATASLMSGPIFGWALWTLFGKPRINVTVFSLFLTTFLNRFFFNPCAVTWLCALLYDDVGGAIRHDFPEGGQCCSGSPESSFHPTALSVSNCSSYRASERLKKYIIKLKSQNKYHIMNYQSKVYLTALLNIVDHLPIVPSFSQSLQTLLCSIMVSNPQERPDINWILDQVQVLKAQTPVAWHVGLLDMGILWKLLLCWSWWHLLKTGRIKNSIEHGGKKVLGNSWISY